MTAKDKQILRGLAFQVATLAARPIEAEKRQLWFDHNALKPTRPLIFCDPENGWNEIIPKDSLSCETPQARDWEFRLRREIFWGQHMNDDRVVEASFTVHHVYTRTGWGMEAVRHGGGNGGAYRWTAPLTDYNHMGKLTFPKVTPNFAETERLTALAQEVFDGLLTIVRGGSFWWSLGLTQDLVFLRGLEQILYDFYDYPDELKQLMAFLRDGVLAELDDLEEMGLLVLNNRATYVGSGGFGFTDELPAEDFTGKVRTKDLWGFAESQETSNISADAFEEFIFPFQNDILSRFGLNCYGCCEPLDLRWHVVEKLPNLRRVSVSPWANKARMAALLQDRYIFSLKPSPTDLAMPVMNQDHVRKSLRQDLQDTAGCCLEIIMKDNHTIGKNPQNVIDWCRIAREEIENL